ncbi:hypothetical protein I4U23_021909 [Adineta vaga]|nr:hypothetical protein I4U23_021909 [Adineta vaga]
MLFVTIALVLLLLSIVFIAYLRSLKSSYSYFKIRGISGPPPRFFFGHYRTLWSVESISRQWQKWTGQYGPIYGLFEGTRPVYIVSDVEFLQGVFVRKFGCFHSRRLPFVTQLNQGNLVHLFAATGNRWRRQRHIINPTFSVAKLKLTSPIVNRCIDALMNKLEQQKDQEFDIYTFYKRLTMDVICHSAFGIHTNMQNDINNPFIAKSAQFFKDNPEKLPIVKLSCLMPWLIPILTQIVYTMLVVFKMLRYLAPRFMSEFEELPGMWIINQVRQVIQARKDQTESEEQQYREIDLLQLMIDATTSDKINTTSTTLASSTYILATRPDIQTKLQAEIDEMYVTNNEELDYNSVNSMNYMDLVIREVLRMFPVALQAVSRECNTETTVCGHIIEKESVIQPDILTLHYDPALWGPEDPSLFIPERHTVRRHPMASMAFGQGPRNCVGIKLCLMELKLCLMELKLCLIRLLRQYSILPGQRIEQGFVLRETLVIQPDAVYIKLEKRQ